MSRRGTVRHCATCRAIYRSDFRRCPSDGGELAVAFGDPLLGATIGEHYVVDGLIGEGAMGRVYLAHHSRLVNRRYALKVLLGDLAADEAMRLRFAREAENASRLEHPNIVGIVDYGRTATGLHYLVMDFVEGQPLSEVLQRGPMSVDRVIRIAHQLCEGLDHAHGRGVIHRDFKPENIIVFGEPGRDNVRIADFGLALSPARDTRLTTTGVACTPAYAAPEQLRGNSIDHRIDLYGLGTTIFEMLSGGILPFAGDYDASVAAKLSHEAPSILTVAGEVPPVLVTVIKRLLARDPQRRPRSARAVIHALEVALHAPRATTRHSDGIVPLEPTPRPPWRSLLGLFVGLLFVAIAIGLTR